MFRLTVIVYPFFPVIYGLFASDNGAYVEKADMIKHVKEWEKGYIPEPVMLLFR